MLKDKQLSFLTDTSIILTKRYNIFRKCFMRRMNKIF